MKKRILSLFAAAAVLMGSASGIAATDDAAPVGIDPRSELELIDGHLRGFGGIPTADEVAGHFTGGVTIVSPKGETVEAGAPVPAESVVKAGSVELCKVVSYGDANSDGKANLSDIAVILRYLADWDQEASVMSLDLDNSGKTNLSDVSVLLQALAGWDVSYGGETFITLLNGNESFLGNDEVSVKALEKAMTDSGFDLKVVDEAGAEDKFFTIGLNLHEKYDFIDGDAVAALTDDPDVAYDDLYIDTYGGNVYVTYNNDAAIDSAVDFVVKTYKEISGFDIYRGYHGTVSGMTESGALYQRGVRGILKTELKLDGTAEMTGDIALAISNAPYTQPKNIIYMIGDGMGKAIIKASELYHKDDLYNGKLAINYMPNVGEQSTYSSLYQTTDSAAGGTALATGKKTGNLVVGQSPEGEVYKNVLELAAEKGKSTGVIATKSVADATPGAFTAHVSGRHEYSLIVDQQIEKLTDGTLDLLLGGGSAEYDVPGKEAALEAAKAAGVTYTHSWEETKNASLPILGLYNAGAMATDPSVPSEPHIAEMTAFALEKLSEDENGFFLMVEGSKIDSWGHSNEFQNEVDEMFEFDCAIAVAMRYVALHPDTALFITADHETGGLIIPPDATSENISEVYRYTTGDHTWVNVPIYSAGLGTEALTGTIENTDIGNFVAALLGEEDFGATSRVETIFDMSEDDIKKIVELNDSEFVTATENGVRVVFGEGIRTFKIPTDSFDVAAEDLKNVFTVRVTFTGTGSKATNLPMISAGGNKAGERQTFISPGETMVYTYVLPEISRLDNALMNSPFLFSTQAGHKADVEISKIEVVVRELGQ